ncbi:hypothetical protein D3C87_952580 [compost metagenome]
MERAILRRENGSIRKDDNLIPFRGRWVARDTKGNYLGHDQYRNDLKDRLEPKYKVEIIGD